MPTDLYAGGVFPDFELPDHRKKPCRLSKFTEPSPMDEKLGFEDGYPLVLIFGCGFFCPRDQQHMRQLALRHKSLRLTGTGRKTGWTCCR